MLASRAPQDNRTLSDRRAGALTSGGCAYRTYGRWGCLVVSSTQHPDEVQHAVADVLGIPLTMVVVECQRMGGAFGGKESQAASLACMAALFAYRTGGRQIRMPRHDDMHQTGKRHEFQWRYEIVAPSRANSCRVTSTLLLTVVIRRTSLRVL